MILFSELQTKFLSGSGCVIGDTSITISGLVDILGNSVTMGAYFGAMGWATLEQGTSNERQITFTNIVVNGNGTSTITGVNTNRMYSPFDVVFTGSDIDHAGGTSIDFGDSPGLLNQFGILANDETILGTWLTPIPTVPTQIANKQYVDNVAILGGAPATTTLPGISMIANSTDISTGNNIRTYGLLNYPVFVQPSQLQVATTASAILSLNSTAAQNITQGQPVFIGEYTANPVTYDTSANTLGSATSGSPVTGSFTVGSQSNRILIVTVAVNSSAGSITNTSVLYGGSSMTRIGGTSTSGTQVYFLANPASGTANISVTCTVSGGPSFNAAFLGYSYYNASSSSPTIASGSSTASLAVTPGSIAFMTAGGFGSGYTVPTFTEATLNYDGIDFAGVAYIASANSAEIPVTNTFTLHIGSGTTGNLFCLCIAPVTVTATNYIRLASAAGFPSAPSGYEKFIGFSLTNSTVGNPITVQYGGVVTGLSGLTAGSIYYLGNTPGTISTSAGTNTKFVGIAITTTSLLIINNLS